MWPSPALQCLPSGATRSAQESNSKARSEQLKTVIQQWASSALANGHPVPSMGIQCQWASSALRKQICNNTFKWASSGRAVVPPGIYCREVRSFCLLLVASFLSVTPNSPSLQRGRSSSHATGHEQNWSSIQICHCLCHIASPSCSTCRTRKTESASQAFCMKNMRTSAISDGARRQKVKTHCASIRHGLSEMATVWMTSFC